MASDKEEFEDLWDKADRRIPVYESKMGSDYVMCEQDQLNYRRHLAFEAISKELGIHYKQVVAIVHENIVDLTPMRNYNHYVHQGVDMAENNPQRYKLDG